MQILISHVRVSSRTYQISLLNCFYFTNRIRVSSSITANNSCQFCTLNCTVIVLQSNAIFFFITSIINHIRSLIIVFSEGTFVGCLIFRMLRRLSWARTLLCSKYQFGRHISFIFYFFLTAHWEVNKLDVSKIHATHQHFTDSPVQSFLLADKKTFLELNDYVKAGSIQDSGQFNVVAMLSLLLYLAHNLFFIHPEENLLTCFTELEIDGKCYLNEIVRFKICETFLIN